MKRPFLQLTPRDVQKFKRTARDWIAVRVYEDCRVLRGYGTLDLIAERRREMFAEIMGTPFRSVFVAKLLGEDTRPGLFRQSGYVPPMRRLR